MKKLIYIMAALIAIQALTMPVAGVAPAGNCEELVGQARSAYYNPKKQGFAGFTASIKPNWKVILGPTATSKNLKVFQSIRFSMVADEKGAVTVTHDFMERPPGGTEDYVKQIHDNVQLLVSGFFGIWSTFMISSPFPEAGRPLKVENPPNQCRVMFTSATTDVVISMTNDLVITELKLITPRSRRTIKPVFQKTAAGLLLTGYHSLYEPVGEEVKADTESTIEYQDVEGMKLPHKLVIRGMLGNQGIAAEVSFDEYVLNPSHR
jgi:hypothetical protein